MLDKHLIAKTSPLANKDNVVLFGDYRITVLSDRLFRVEKDGQKIFTDDATQAVWFRNLPVQKYTVKTFADKVQIKTDKVTLVVDNDYDNSYVLIGGKRVKLDNEQNLLGTYRTLDFCRGGFLMDYGAGTAEEIKLGNGVCSKNGVAVIDDKDSLILGADGMLKSRREQEVDQYIFAFGTDYMGAIKAFYDITGYAPKIPRYALGNWWSRYYAYTEDEYLAVLRRFEENAVPLTVATIDMDWHYSDNLREELGVTDISDFTGCNDTNPEHGWLIGWTGYTWNKNLFPDYKSFLQKIKDKNLKITLNLHPKEGVRFFEDAYESMCKEMGVDPATKQRIPFDLTNDKFINNYFKVLHKPYENDGVAFWWIDWQQGTGSQMAGLDPLWSLNHYHYLDNGLNFESPLILSRYCNQGAHRYPLGFSGDTEMRYETLDYLPYFTATASNVGYCWWSHDIGGFRYGDKDNELFARSVQLAVFFPIMRLHCNSALTLTKEPWYYNTDGGHGHLVMSSMRYRHSLIPYIYSEGYKNHSDGLPLIKPLYYLYPNCKQSYKYKNQYFFGDLLVVPITSPSIGKGVSKVSAFIPEGKWTDIFTGEEIEAGENGLETTLYRFMDSIPVFAKAGSTMVRSGDKHTNKVDNPKNLILDIYTGDGEYSLYEDDGDKKAWTNIKNAVLEDKLQTNIAFVGDRAVFPTDRQITINLKNIKDTSVTVLCNGKTIGCEVYVDKFTTVVIKNVDHNAEYTVISNVDKTDKKQKFINYAIELLKEFCFDNNQKFWLLQDINNLTAKPGVGWVNAEEPIFDWTTKCLEKLMADRAFPKTYIKILCSALEHSVK